MVLWFYQGHLPSTSEAWLLTSGQGDYQSLGVGLFEAQSLALYQPGRTPLAAHHHYESLNFLSMTWAMLHIHFTPLALCIRLLHWCSCPRLKSILCPGFISQGFPSLRLKLIMYLLIAWWSCCRTSRGFPLGMTVPPINVPRPDRHITIWSGTAYSTRQAWLICFIRRTLPCPPPGDPPSWRWLPHYWIGGSLLQVVYSEGRNSQIYNLWPI